MKEVDAKTQEVQAAAKSVMSEMLEVERPAFDATFAKLSDCSQDRR